MAEDLDPARRLPPLNWLRAFEAAARHMSFTGAAQELALTQSSVSQSVKHLEEWLDRPLFLRHPRSLELTEAGAAYLPVLREIFDSLQAGTDDLFGVRRSGPVVLRVTSSLTYVWLVPRLRDFFAAHPDIDLRLVSPEEQTLSGFESADVEIRYGGGDWPGAAAEKLFEEKLFPVCSPDLAQADAPIAAPEDLFAHRLIHVVGEPESWCTWFRAAGLEPRASMRSVQFDLHVMAAHAAMAGVGVALGLWPVVNDALADGRLIAPFEVSIPTRDAHYVVVPKTRELDDRAAAVRDWLIAAAGET